MPAPARAGVLPVQPAPRRTLHATDGGALVDLEALESQAREASVRFADADPFTVLSWAAGTFGSRFAVASSLADSVVLHMASRVEPGVRVLFLDTGYHFDETLLTRDAVRASYDVRLITVTPQQSVAEQDAAHGPQLHRRDPDACCRLRKVEPLRDALAPYLAWASGIRRDEASTRRDVMPVEWDARRGKVKVNPLALWSPAQVDAYAAKYDLLVNPLVEVGFASIGCAPCTRPVAPGEDPRAGRWNGTGKTECGLHL